jgi:fructosamine-3-kinase
LTVCIGCQAFAIIEIALNAAGPLPQNNFVSTAAGAVVIDVVPYSGHPEADLALVDYFEPVLDDVFAAYREIVPIDPGFADRRLPGG